MYNVNGTYQTVGGQSCSLKGVIDMNNYVTWDQLLQVGILITAVMGIIVYIIIEINKRK